MLKARLKSALGGMASRLPWGGRHAILDALVADFGRFEVFQELARQLRVESVCVSGANGTVWGSLTDVLLRRYAESGLWSPQTIGFFQKFFHCRGGGTFVDIGANIGLTLIPIARDSGVRCFGFEPEPRNFLYLKSNIEANCRNNNVTISQLALFDKKAELPFELSPVNFGDHRIRISTNDGSFNESSWETILVQADTLDDVLQPDTLKPPLGVKIDTQGAEAKIFAGGAKTLSAADAVSVEYYPYGMRRIGGNVAGEFQFLEDHFREGSVLPGDSEGEIEWRPIGDVVAELKDHWANPDIGIRYFDVFVRK